MLLNTPITLTWLTFRNKKKRECFAEDIFNTSVVLGVKIIEIQTPLLNLGIFKEYNCLCHWMTNLSLYNLHLFVWSGTEVIEIMTMWNSLPLISLRNHKEKSSSGFKTNKQLPPKAIHPFTAVNGEFCTSKITESSTYNIRIMKFLSENKFEPFLHSSLCKSIAPAEY